MKIIVPVKLVPDDQDIQVAADRNLDYAKAKPIASAYDLNALEVAAQLAAAANGEAIAISVGDAKIDDSKAKKNVLSRGMNELRMIADDACGNLDAFQTAAALKELVDGVGAWDLIICGDGSADNYAQQVDVQLAAKLGVPSVNGVASIEVADGRVVCKRVLEDIVETVEVALPAVISVTPEVAQPRIPGMKDILAAGKKPMAVTAADATVAAVVETVECLAPEAADRKCQIADASAEGAIQNFAAALKAAL